MQVPVALKEKRYNEAFTILELLVVLSILSLLASVVFASLNGSQQKVRVASARQEIGQVVVAMTFLANDTGKWPRGCPPWTYMDDDFFLDISSAGLVSAPLAGVYGDCEWTAEDVAKWRGPYIGSVMDPWDKSYKLDLDYHPYENCPTIPEEEHISAVVSCGPNGSCSYDCDDVFFPLVPDDD